MRGRHRVFYGIPRSIYNGGWIQMFMKNHGTIWFEYFVETEVVQNKIPDH